MAPALSVLRVLNRKFEYDPAQKLDICVTELQLQDVNEEELDIVQPLDGSVWPWSPCAVEQLQIMWVAALTEAASKSSGSIMTRGGAGETLLREIDALLQSHCALPCAAALEFLVNHMMAQDSLQDLQAIMQKLACTPNMSQAHQKLVQYSFQFYLRWMEVLKLPIISVMYSLSCGRRVFGWLPLDYHMSPDLLVRPFCGWTRIPADCSWHHTQRGDSGALIRVHRVPALAPTLQTWKGWPIGMHLAAHQGDSMLIAMKFSKMIKWMAGRFAFSATQKFRLLL